MTIIDCCISLKMIKKILVVLGVVDMRQLLLNVLRKYARLKFILKPLFFLAGLQLKILAYIHGQNQIPNKVMRWALFKNRISFFEHLFRLIIEARMIY